ncbi:hypothetical protein Sjap_018363 [Stephania japonica]|uniref:RING-type domain-containing protein n=1 Tax=Stephania japonica TaxID=461633 RepID=A0AAP0NKF8_9MAGN
MNPSSFSNPQIIGRHLDHLKSSMLLWRSQATTHNILDEQYFQRMMTNFHQASVDIAVIIVCGSEEMKERAKALRSEIGVDCSELMTRRMVALDPLLNCVGRMALKSAQEVEEEICVVCLDDFVTSGLHARVTECGHYFHYTCIFKWLQSSSVCPSCRLRGAVEFRNPTASATARREGTTLVGTP